MNWGVGMGMEEPKKFRRSYDLAGKNSEGKKLRGSTLRRMKLGLLITSMVLIPNTVLAFAVPDQKLTPGVVKTITQKEVCVKGYTKDARHVTQATKKKVMVRYGLDPKTLHLYEIDHLISLELGGDNVVENLWPQPMGEARKKDVVETWLHRQMCKPGSSLTLGEAQKEIRADWSVVYKKIKAPKGG